MGNKCGKKGAVIVSTVYYDLSLSLFYLVRVELGWQDAFVEDRFYAKR